MRGGRSRGSRDEGGLRNWGCVCQSGFLCACACLCSLERKGELGKRGEKAGGIKCSVNLEERRDGLKIRETSVNSRLTAL